MKKDIKNKIIKLSFIAIALIFIVPTIIYLIKNKTVANFNNYFSWTLIKPQSNEHLIINTVAFGALYALICFGYLYITKKQKELFKNTKQIFTFIIIISTIFLISMPYTSSDVYYYIGTGWLDAKYDQNPYYVTVEEIAKNTNDEILENTGEWANSTVVYGPAWAFICKILSGLSFGNLTLALYIFKLVALLIHLGNCYLIYKITKKKKLLMLYGLNPFVLLEGLVNVHNDLYIVFFMLLGIKLILENLQKEKIKKKENVILKLIKDNRALILGLASLSVATAIKYIAIIIAPFVLIYYFRKGKPLKRFVYSIAYGLIYLGIIFLIYLIYIQDITIFMAMFEQVEKYTQSIWTSLQLVIGTGVLFKILKSTAYIMFVVYCIKLVIDMIFKKKITMKNAIQQYTKIIFLLIFFILTNFHQWYLLWFIPAILFANGKNANMINTMLLVSEIPALTYFWHFSESWKLGYGYSIVIIFLTILLITVNKNIIVKPDNN